MHRAALQRQLDAYDQRRRALLDDLAALPPAWLTARPQPGKWTLLEIAEHLARAERVVLAGLPEPSAQVAQPQHFWHRLKYRLVLAILRWRLPVRVPAPAMLPKGSTTLAEVQAQWDENHRWLRHHLASSDAATLRQALFVHPVSGPLTLAQVLPLAEAHLGTHRRQIERRCRLLAAQRAAAS